MFSIELGQAITIWTARLAAALYVIGLALLIRKQWTAYRRVSTVGLTTYLLHVAFAYHIFYQWSHSIAYRETARQTAELFGVGWGGGLYLNYLFTMLWSAECAASWVPLAHRNRAIIRARFVVHAFLTFMVLNATVVVWVLRSRRTT
ncbi:MAG TPA: hypothetical protein VES20_04010 [Bryobacteraceae bacterium]|nr:hypothetical protein [Bryobacteraceae bacterium]